MSSPDLTNLELFYKYYHKNFKKQSDCLVLFIHWLMIQNKFKCSIQQNVSF